MSRQFKRVAVLGLGLLGGSVAMAARRAGIARSIVAAGRRQEPLRKAAAAGIVDEIGAPAEVAEGADLIVLDGGQLDLDGRQGDDILDAFIFAGNDCRVRDVMVGGVWQVTDGRHAAEENAARGYRNALRELLSSR